MNSKIKGYIYGAVAAATYGMNPLFALPLYSVGMDPDSVLFIRYLLAIAILGIMIKARGRNFKIETGEIAPLATVGILFAISSISLFSSYNHMDAGIASTLLFVYPIIVALIMAIFFKERISLQTAVCMGISLVGIALLYRGSDGSTLSWTGTLLVFTSALSYSVYIVMINKSRLKGMPTVKLNFYMLIFGWIILAARVLLKGELNTPPAEQWYMWGCMLALALLPTAISLICTTKAVQYVGSTPTAILGVLEPVTAVFFGVTLFSESLNLRNWIGLVLIIAAVTVVVAGSDTKKPLVHFRKMFPKIRKQGN